MQRIALVVMGFLLVSAGAWAGPQASAPDAQFRVPLKIRALRTDTFRP